LLNQYLERFAAILTGVDCQIISGYGISQHDLQTPIAIVDVLHRRASNRAPCTFVASNIPTIC
jgi:hypothetical protein